MKKDEKISNNARRRVCRMTAAARGCEHNDKGQRRRQQPKLLSGVDAKAKQMATTTVGVWMKFSVIVGVYSARRAAFDVAVRSESRHQIKFAQNQIEIIHPIRSNAELSIV